MGILDYFFINNKYESISQQEVDHKTPTTSFLGHNNTINKKSSIKLTTKLMKTFQFSGNVIEDDKFHHYQVKDGETLEQIASKFWASTNVIRTINNMNFDQVYRYRYQVIILPHNIN